MKWLAGLLAAVLMLLYVSVITAPAREPGRAESAPPRLSGGAVESRSLARPGTESTTTSSPAGPSVTRDSEWKPRDAPLVVVRRLRQTWDWRAFVDHAMQVGGGAYLVMAREAIDRCYPVREGGIAGAEQRFVQGLKRDDPRQHQQRIEAYRGLIAGCAGFEARPVAREEYMALQRRIEGEGDAMAMADALNRGRIEPGEARLTARSLLEAEDPVLIRSVGFFLARERKAAIKVARSDDPRLREIDLQEQAWHRAACELGDDCGPDDAFTRRRCAFNQQCDGGGADAELLQATNRIVAGIRHRDWERLGL